MDEDQFYERMKAIIVMPPVDRHRQMLAVHTGILHGYVQAIRGIDAARAAAIGVDGRTIGQVVGHIAEWDRFAFLSAAEMLSGLDWPPMFDRAPYPESDGSNVPWNSIDEFNAYAAQKHAALPWAATQDLALRMAEALYALYSHPALNSAEALERTRPFRWKFPDGTRIPVAAGWYLWGIPMEHEGIEHAADIYARK